MSVTTVRGYDATHANIGSLPAGQAAGYCTGSGDVPWTAEDWAAHPGAVRIDQSPTNTGFDETADVLDVENGAATFGDCAPWALAALANFRNGARPGQRVPAIYCSASNVTAVVNALIAGGVKGGVTLWVASWTGDLASADSEVANGSGPFPIVGMQYANSGNYDDDVFSWPWLENVSKAPSPHTGPSPYPAPAGLKVASKSLSLTWDAVVVAGKAVASYSVRAYGLDNQLFAAATPTTNSVTLNGLVPGWTYNIFVWANGGPVAPPHATLKVTV